MKKVLVIYYSQTGQLKGVVDSFISELGDDEIKVDIKPIIPKVDYQFPWSFYEFFDEFPEAVFMDGCEIEKLTNLEDKYDLIILGYTVWYMAPSIPITAFMSSKQAKKIFKNTPVVTLVACRDMWVLAQEKIKDMLRNVEAKHIDHVALSDQGGSVFSLITLPRFLLTGKKNPFAFFPPAGIKESDISNASRFGERLNAALKNNLEKNGEPLLKNLGAVNVNGKLIATEKIADKSFKIWSKFIKLAGKKRSFGRKVVISIYVVFLIILLFTVVPLNILARKILNKFQKNKLKNMEDYYELPSGK